jgi:Fe-S-cluster containining protein
MEKKADTSSDFSQNNPFGWNAEQFREMWYVFLESIVEENSSSLVPRKRVRYQIEQSCQFRDIAAGWDSMDGSQRLDAWKKLLVAAEASAREILPVCVQCGECCRMGSPTLHADDIEALRSGKIPWEHLMTLRKGEPARSPFDGRPFVLPGEKIKIREKEGSRECVFLDGQTDRCTIYPDRPLQCRAQACWDPAPAMDLANQPALTRQDIFQGVDLLLEIISEHERRCGFEELTAAFDKLSESNGHDVDDVLRLLSYEEHFRQFVCEKFHIPPENAELVFGRSFSEMLGLFGYHAVDGPDGTRVLTPETENPPSDG